MVQVLDDVDALGLQLLKRHAGGLLGTNLHQARQHSNSRWRSDADSVQHQQTTGLETELQCPQTPLSHVITTPCAGSSTESLRAVSKSCTAAAHHL